MQQRHAQQTCISQTPLAHLRRADICARRCCLAQQMRPGPAQRGRGAQGQGQAAAATQGVVMLRPRLQRRRRTAGKGLGLGKRDFAIDGLRDVLGAQNTCGSDECIRTSTNKRRRPQRM